MDGMAILLGKGGFLLFTLGLLIGAMIPRFLNPRMGLSAHLTAVQSGTALIAFGLFWQHFGITAAASPVIGFSLLLSFYALVTGLILAATFGASEALPIAGKGFQSSKAKERVVSILAIGSSIWMVMACLAICAFSFIA